MRRIAILLLLLAGCGGSGGAPPPESTAAAAPAPSIAAPAPSATTNDTITTTSSQLPATSSTTSTTATTTTQPPAVAVSTPGTYDAAEFEIHISFESQIEGVDSDQFGDQSIAILNADDGWGRAGFTFVADDESDLRVVLAEGPEVDALCLPLETYGKVSCQNGPVVALNADRWRLAGDDWDSTLDAYRTYLINHEVGHLIGLRHPVERCPTESKISALMEPQTNNLQDCVGNGIPLDWEIEWARTRPIVVGPDPAWNGPRPTWPIQD